MEKRKFYLAYGSNLNVSQMRKRCPEAAAVGTAQIPGYRLAFEGYENFAYLTIKPEAGSVVPVAVWSVTAEDEKRLDAYEGFPVLYRKERKRVAVTPLEGESAPETVEAFVYVMDGGRSSGPPSLDYMRACAEGYAAFGFHYEGLCNAFMESLLSNNGGMSK